MSFLIGIGIGLCHVLGGAAPEPTGLWLLATGSWDDSGEWVDADVWNDGA